MGEPNGLAREAMAKAADEFDKLVSSAEVEADLWRQVGHHLRRGELVKAHEIEGQARRLKDERTTRHGDRLIKFVECADEAFWQETYDAIVGKLLDDEIAALDLEQCKRLIELHRIMHGDDRCDAHQLLTRRLKELER